MLKVMFSVDKIIFLIYYSQIIFVNEKYFYYNIFLYNIMRLVKK